MTKNDFSVPLGCSDFHFLWFLCNQDAWFWGCVFSHVWLYLSVKIHKHTHTHSFIQVMTVKDSVPGYWSCFWSLTLYLSAMFVCLDCWECFGEWLLSAFACCIVLPRPHLVGLPCFGCFCRGVWLHTSRIYNSRFFLFPWLPALTAETFGCVDLCQHITTQLIFIYILQGFCNELVRLPCWFPPQSNSILTMTLNFSHPQSASTSTGTSAQHSHATVHWSLRGSTSGDQQRAVWW